VLGADGDLVGAGREFTPADLFDCDAGRPDVQVADVDSFAGHPTNLFGVGPFERRVRVRGGAAQVADGSCADTVDEHEKNPGGGLGVTGCGVSVRVGDIVTGADRGKIVVGGERVDTPVAGGGLPGQLQRVRVRV
jgi:hypothetical protein